MRDAATRRPATSSALVVLAFAALGLLTLASPSTSYAGSGSGPLVPVAGTPNLPPLYGVSCPAATTCFAVGGSSLGSIVSTTNGRTWRTTVVPGSGTLIAIDCVGRTVCVAVGYATNTTASAVETTDAVHWRLMPLPSGTHPLQAVSCPVAGSCLAVGIDSLDHGGPASVVALQHGTWASRAPPGQGLQAVSCSTTADCLTAGADFRGGVWRSTDFGATWTSIVSLTALPNQANFNNASLCTRSRPCPDYDQFTGVVRLSGGRIVATGGNQCGGQGVTFCSGMLAYTDDNGAHWSWSSSGIKFPFVQRVVCPSTGRCFAVSDTFTSSTLLSSGDGVNWTVVQPSPTLLSAFDCSPSGRCAAVGSTGNRGVLLTSPVAAIASAVARSSGDPRVAPLASSLPTITAALRSPVHDLVNVAITLAALLFISFPAQLFNRTFDEHYDEIRAGWRRRLRLPPASAAPRRPSRIGDGIRFGAVVLGAGVLGCALNPKARMDTQTAVNFVATVLAITAGVTVAAGVALIYRRSQGFSRQATLHALPAGLVVALACVLISRLAEFRPGYLYGVIAMLAFALKLPRRPNGHVIALSHAAALVVGVTAWLVWIPVNHAASHTGASYGVILLDDFVAALFVSALVGGAIQLLPLSFLPGGELAAWHRGAWFATFGVVVFGLLAVMLNPNSRAAHAGNAPLATIILLLVIFGAGSVAFAGYWQERDRRTRRAADVTPPRTG
ncbi:MAG: exo-alpha-sialidase [Frankiales bacterium]|nr:exo-alpha-sialidase [Frankiales bacterium]